MEKYTFIHPTKSGGTALETFFSENYSDYITGTGHENICENNNNPIIIVRDVKERFISMYKYWKNGSTDCFKRDNLWKEKFKNTTITEFINMIKNNDKNLYHDFTWQQHFDLTTNWLGCANYENIIIIKYEKNLNSKIQKLLNLLKIPNKNIQVPVINKSCQIDLEYQFLFDDYNKFIDNFLEDYFKKDLKLINTIENNPELFKLVI